MLYELKNEDYVNKTIKKVRYFLKNKNFTEEVKDYLTISLTSFICTNDFFIYDIIYDTFKNIRIIFNNSNTYEIIKSKFKNEIDNETLGVYYLSTPNNLWTKKTIYQKKDYVILGYKNLSTLELLDSFIHELRHALTSVRDTNYYIDYNTYFKRSGFSDLYFYKDDASNRYLYKSSFDEAINSYFTEVMVNEIIRFKDMYIKDLKIKNLLNKIKNKPYNSDLYIYERMLIKEILANDYLMCDLNKKCYFGNTANLDDIAFEMEDIMDDLDDINIIPKIISFKKKINNITF